MTLKTSLIITGDASAARAEVQSLAKAVDAAAAGTRAAAAPAQQLDNAQKSVAASARELSGATAGVDTSFAAAAKTARQLSTVNGAVATSSGAAVLGVRQLTKAVNDNEAAARRHQFALRNTGQQVGDFGLSVAAGISPAQAFAQQAGQMGYALSEMGGRLGKVGAFLTGPWGIALTIGAAVVAPLIGKLFETAEATKTVELGSSGLADAQGALGQVFDMTTGKLKSQNAAMAAANELMRLNIRLTAINLRADAAKESASSQKALASVGSISVSDRIKGSFTDPRLFGTIRGAIDGTERGQQNASNLSTIVRDLQSGRTTNEQVLRASEKLDFSGLKITRQEFQAAIRDGLSAVVKLDTAARADRSLDAGRLDPAFRNEGRTKTPPKARSTEARDDFGRDSATKLAGIVGQFDGTPDVIEKTNAKVRELDDLIDDLGHKRPPGFKDLIAEAEAAKVTVRGGLIAEISKAFDQPKTLADKAAFAIGQLDAVIADLGKNKPPSFEKLIADAHTAKAAVREGVQKPYADFLQQQQDGLSIQRLVIDGRADEAEALKTVLSLQRTMPPLTLAQKDAVLATVQAIRQQAAELDGVRENARKYHDALGGIKGVVEDATQAFVRGDLGQLIKSPGKLLEVFQQFQGQKLFDSLFDGVFRDLQDQIDGTSGVKDASDRMAASVDRVSQSSNGLRLDFEALGRSARAASSDMSAPAGETDTEKLARLFSLGNGVTGPNQDDIVVQLEKKNASSQAFFSDAIGKVSGKIVGAFTNPETGARIGKSLGQFAGKALGGAAEGAAINSFMKPLADALGVRTSKLGAQIGGAVGSFVPLPFAKEIGAVLGSVVGGLFKSAKTGSATIGAVNGQAGITGTNGNNDDMIAAASGLAGSVNDTIESIIGRLGGSLGSYAVSIGQRDDKFVVDTSGRGSTKFGKANDGITAYKTAEEAAAAALIDAIKDGAVAGVSPAIAKAIQSSPDVNKALNEAMKVQELELTLGGIGAQIDRAFRDFENQAKERVRIASTYGFDVVAVEKRNAEDRIKLAEQLASQQVGSLQNLIKDMTQGSLFEGTAMEKITALDAAIAKAKTDLAAGVEGAGDTLAGLYQQRLAASKDAYGTTAAYAADRNAILDEARAAIAAANAKITAAKAGPATSDPALLETNAALDENNDQNARIIATLQDGFGTLSAQLSAGRSSPLNLKSLARY